MAAGGSRLQPSPKRVEQRLHLIDRGTRVGLLVRCLRRIGARVGRHDFDGETDKGKFRRLDAHVVSPLTEKGYVEVEPVGTQKRVFLTEDGRNTLRAFRYVLE